MNREKLARTTFVLFRETHEQLGYVSRRMGVSRSELVRDVLADPVAMMAKWCESLPEHPTPEECLASGQQLQLDTVGFLRSNLPSIGLEISDPANTP